MAKPQKNNKHFLYAFPWKSMMTIKEFSLILFAIFIKCLKQNLFPKQASPL